MRLVAGTFGSQSMGLPDKHPLFTSRLDTVTSDNNHAPTIYIEGTQSIEGIQLLTIIALP